MKSVLFRFRPAFLFLGLLALLQTPAHGQGLTLQIGSPAPPPTPLVNHGETWRWRKGTNAPQANWQSVTDATLDATWAIGPGGFGYGDAGIVGEATTLSDMLNTYKTFMIRKSFAVSSVDTNVHLQLTVDYDDAFVAWLDGAELQRANTTNGVGTPVVFNATATGSREASCCNAPVNPPSVYDLGAVSNRLADGTHVLALQCINQSLSSSDAHLIADLALTGGSAGGPINGTYLSIVYGNSLVLNGSNTVAGSTRVSVNGDDAAFDTVTHQWSKTNALVPGVNRLFIAALDDAGNLLGSTNRLIISEISSNNVGGPLGTSTVLGPGVVHVTSTLVVPPGGTLSILPGTVCLMNPVANILATNATVSAVGTAASPVYFLPSDGSTTNWGGVIVRGSAASLVLQHVETIAGHIELFDGATGTLEDSYFHDYWTASPAIIHTLGQPNHVTLNMRRCHVARYQEVLSQLATNHIEDCLLEYQGYSGDGIDFDFGQEGSYIRRCTLRRGLIFNTDALDMGEFGADGTRVLIDGCLLHDFIDKGVSMGVQVYVTVTNTLIYNVDSGFGIKDNSEAGIYNCTVANANYGYHQYNKANPASPSGGGYVTNSFNNIFWSITNASISLANGSTLEASYTDFQNATWPGAGNLSVDPLFVNPLAHDFQLSVGSPCLGAGLGGENQGITWPVGGLPGAPFALAAIYHGTNPVELVWRDDADNEAGFRIERSTDGVAWMAIGGTHENVTNILDYSGVGGVKYYYRVAATNASGISDFSNPASAMRQGLVIIAGGNVGGTITQDTCWADNGLFTVTSSVTVPAGVTLYIKPGAQVLFNSGLKMTVNGQLTAVGSPTNHIRFTKSASGNWGSLDFINAPLESRVEFADFDSCAGTTIGGHAAEIHVNGASKVFFNQLVFANTPAQQYISFDGSSFIVQNSTFPTYPWATSAPEMLHGINGINAGGYGIFRSNYFGHTYGFNDTIDFTGGQRPGPILQFIGNVFDGAGDDHLDLDSADAWIEGNIFMHVHRDPNRTDDAYDTASSISGGVDFAGQYSEWTIINNLFYDMDHAVLAKEGCRFIFVNNTLVHMNKESGSGMQSDIAAFNFTDKQLPLPDPARGAGAYIAGNILWDAPLLVANYNAANETVIFENNLLPLAWAGPGSNNVVADPLLNLELITTVTGATWQTVQAALTPKAGSPALGTGIGGRDKGGLNPLGLLVFGGPTGTVVSTSATLTVAPGGVFNWGTSVPPYLWGYTHYQWKLDDGPWSAETSITSSPTIALSDLSTGTHTVYVTGKNDAGYYQDDPFVYPSNSLFAAQVTASRTWIVGSVDTDNDGMPDDWEIAHGLLPNDPSDASADPDLDGMSNLQEFLAGTDPQDKASRLLLGIAAPGTGDVELQFSAMSNKTYTVQIRTNLTAGVWLRLQDIPSAPANRAIILTNSLAEPARFFRVVTPAVP